MLWAMPTLTLHYSIELSLHQSIDDNGVLTVRRLRPNKRILTAKKDESGKWRSIGVPDIDRKKDLQILGYVARVEDDAVQTDQLPEEKLIIIKQKAQIVKSRNRGSELG